MVGVSAVGLTVIALLVFGVSLSLPAFTALTLGVAIVATAIGVARHRAADAPDFRLSMPTRMDKIVVVALAVLFGAYSLAVLTQYTSAPMAEWDSWTIWTRKGIALFSLGTLDPDFWSAKPYAFMHQDYPLLLPLLESLHFKAIGRIDSQSVHVQFWLLMVAFPWAMGYLAARSLVGRAVVWAPIVLGAAAVPAFVTVIISGLADVPVALFVAGGVLALGLWVDTRDRFNLAVAVILLAGAASIKNEGLLAAGVALLIAAVVSLSERPRRALKDLGVGAIGFVLAVAPWQLWAAAHSVPKDVNAGDGLNPIYLAKHIDRAWPAIKGLEAQITDQSRWSYFLPLAVVVAGVAIFTRRATRAAAFYLLAGAAFFLSLVWAYWASPYPLDWYISLSAFRIVDGLVAITMAALVHLAPRLAGVAGRDVPVEEADEEPTAALEPGADEPEPGRRTPVPAGLLAFWRA
jgi:hypothetical protein